MPDSSNNLNHIVSDPLVCHGTWTFRGTRIFVSDILDQIEKGMPRDLIVKEWRGDVTLAAIQEVERVGRDLLSRRRPPPLNDVRSA